MKKRNLFILLIVAVCVSFCIVPRIDIKAATTSVKLNKSKATTYVDYTVQLKLNGATGSVTWKSSDEKVATVSKKGLVTGKKAGTVTITAKNNGKIYTCKTTVKKCSSGLDFVLIKGGYEVSGIGSCKDTAVVIPKFYKSKKVINIGESAFDNCDALESVIIPNSVTSIGNKAFCRCRNLKKVTISKSVTSIGERAFGLSAIENIVIPNGVKVIGKKAFSDCYLLKSVSISKSVNKIEDGAFDSCRVLESIVVDSANSVYDSRNACNAVIETGSNMLLFGCINTVIPSGVTDIGADSFSGARTPEKVEIPNGVLSIGDVFYQNAYLKSVTIPESVISIDDLNFYDCEGLQNIYVKKGSYAEKWLKEKGFLNYIKYTI